MEASLLFDGEALVFGQQFSQTPGDTSKDKRAVLCSADAGYIREALAQSTSFLIKQVPDTLLLIPSGYMIVICAVSHCKAMRWSVSSDEEDSERVKLALRFQLASYEELRAPQHGYTQFLDHLAV